MEAAVKSLPSKLQNVMKGYEIFTARTADDLINHHRNRMDLAVTDPDTRNGFRSHYAVTDVEGHSQAFVEWIKSPFENRYVHFSEQMNARGTAAHEAEHANDAALGKPSQNDPEFDRLYRQEANKVLSGTRDLSDLGWLDYYIRANNGSDGQIELNAPPGKTELFAELAAVAVTGETSSKNVTAQDLVAYFPETYKYVRSKIQSGEW